MKRNPSFFNGLVTIFVVLLYISNRLFLNGSSFVFSFIILSVIAILILAVLESRDLFITIFGTSLMLSVALALLHAYRLPDTDFGILIGLLVDCFLIIFFIRESIYSTLPIKVRMLDGLLALLLLVRLALIVLAVPSATVLNILLVSGLLTRIFVLPVRSKSFSHMLTIYSILILISLAKTVV